MKAMETPKTKTDEDDDTKETDPIRSYLNFEGPEERQQKIQEAALEGLAR